MALLHHFPFIIIILTLIFTISSATDPYSQALITLKSNLIIPPNLLPDWVILNNHSSPTLQSCSWTGVQCDPNNTKITSLNLSHKTIHGSLSFDPFDHFLDLVNLDISHNSFSGELPLGLFNLSNLVNLDISRNNFSGVFPDKVSNLGHLEVLNAFSNSFSGGLPTGVCENGVLRVLNFAGSYFSGGIPGSYGSCERLEFLHLAGNLLTGRLPVELGWLKSVRHVEIGYNSYEGGIPWQFGNMSELRYLDIAGANLTGLVPKELSNLTKLDTLFLFKNSLSGSIPDEFSNVLSLASLDLSDNMLTGQIPEGFSRLSNLKLLSLMYNDMNGTVPEGIGSLPNLESLLIWDNFFSGKLPQELGQHSKLKEVDVSTNEFVGVIPPGICSGGELSRLMLFSNYFSGGLSSISNCSSLIRVRLEDNLFSGDISLDFEALSDVSYVDLSDNSFTGGIPSGLFRASKLEHFSVSNNPHLGGILPEETWSLPALRNFSASSCNISGNIPESISFCENLEALNLAENNLSGEIPVKFGSLQKLKYLNLSYNDLSGSIPVENTFKSMDSSSFLGNPNLCGAPLEIPCHQGVKGMALGAKSNHKVAWVLVLCAVVVALSAFLLGIVYYRRQNVNRHWKMVSFGGLPELTAADVLESFNSIEPAKTTYSSNPVCKVVFLTGMTIVVRKIEWGTKSSNLLDFINQIGNLRHNNLVQLFGFCYNKNLGYLLFECSPNGNLAEKIGIKRDWASKHKLVINIAKGLCFLHHDCLPAIPHGNLKASNVVFDENMEPRLAEFGFKTISAMESGEYKGLMEHDLKDDIFNFGEVVLEILTNGRRKNGGISIHKTPKDVLLKGIYGDNEVTTSSSKSIQEEIKLVLEVVLRCTTSNQTDRPSMEDVLKILSREKR